MKIAVPTSFGFIAALLLSTMQFQIASANPTNKSPQQPLDAHGTIPAAVELVKSLYELYDSEEQWVIEAFERSDNPASWSERQIAKSAGRIWKARRDVEHLKWMGEPAAFDLERKLTLLAIQVERFGQTYRGTPKGMQLMSRIQLSLRRGAPGLSRFLQQASDALKGGKLEIFEQLMEKKGIELYEQLVFFTPSARKPFNAAFNSLLDQGDSLLSQKRKEEYIDLGKSAMMRHVAAANELPGEAKRIADEIAANGTAQIGDNQTATAAEAFAHVVDLWGAASAGLMRAAATQWAFTNRSRTQIQPEPSELKVTALRSLAAVVDAAAASTSPDQAQAVYSALLEEISVADRRIASYSDDVFKACEPGLEQLAGKAPELKPRIERYRRATSEPLRWRSEFAYQQVQNLKRQSPQVSMRLNAQEEVPGNIRPNFANNVPRQSMVAPRSFSAPANWLVQEAAARLIGESVTEEELLRLSTTSQTAVVPFDSLHFGNVRVPLAAETEIEDLMEAIVVDPQHGPLTRESADAVSAARYHDYLNLSGRIEQVHLESLVTRFATLPSIAHVLVPLGKIPELGEGTSPLTHAVWRLDLTPLWAQQRYFVVRLPEN